MCRCPRRAFLSLYPAGDDEETASTSARANADRVFIWQNWMWAHLHSVANGTYYYHFSREPPIPRDAEIAEHIRGAFRGAEIPYVFRHLGVRDWPWTAPTRELSRVGAAYWVNFARTGDPNDSTLPSWPRFDAAAPSAMHFGDARSAADRPPAASISRSGTSTPARDDRGARPSAR